MVATRRPRLGSVLAKSVISGCIPLAWKNAWVNPKTTASYELGALSPNKNFLSPIRTSIAARDALYDFFVAAAASTLMGDMGARGCFIVCTAVTESLGDADTRAIAAGYVADVDRVFLERFERSRKELNHGVDPASAAAVASAMLQTLAVRARTGSDRDALAAIARAAVIAICGPADAKRGS